MLGEFPTRPLSVTYDFAQPILTLGAQAHLSSALGTTRYAWTLAAADNLSDLDAKKASYRELGGTEAAADADSRISFKPLEAKSFRFTLHGLSGTGFVQINELELIGAERAPLP